MELVTEHLERASGLYRERGVGDRARLCAGLAKFYAKRDLAGEENRQGAHRAEAEEDRRFDERRAQAAAQVAAAESEWNRLEAGFRTEEIAQAKASRDQIAARLTKLKAGPRPQEIEAARARQTAAPGQRLGRRNTNPRLAP